MRRTFIITLFVAVSLVPAIAEFDRSKKPEPGPAPTASFPDYKTVTLDNGLKIFVIEDDRKPSVTFRLLIKGGDIHDGSKAGLAGFVAGLLNRGTKNRDGQQFAKEADSIGVAVEASSGADAISVSAGGLTKYTEQILELFADAVLNPTFPAEELEKLRRRALSNLIQEKKQPGALAGKLAGKVVFGDHPYGRYATEDSITSIQQDDLSKYHQTWFAPNNATLAVVGDVKPDEIVPKIEKAFAAWGKKDVPQIKMAAPPEMKGLSIHLVDRPESVQSNILVAQPGPARNGADNPELNVVNSTLGGGFSGRLFQNLREKNGWTYGSYSAFGPNRYGGMFTASAETRNEVTVPAIKEILAEMKRLQTEPVPTEELSLQREYNVGNYLLSLENAGRTAVRVQDIDLYGLPADYYKRYAKRMADVTSQDVEQLAKKYISTENTAIIVVGKAADIKGELEKLGPVVTYDTELKPVDADAAKSRK